MFLRMLIFACVTCIPFFSIVVFGQESSTPPPMWPEDALVVAGDLGPIQGAYTLTSPNGKKIIWFAGIPYADPMSYTGDNRFKPSSLKSGPLRENNSTYLAVNPLVFCPQRDIFYKSNTNMSDLGSVMMAYKKSLSRESQKEFNQNPMYMGSEDCLVINVNTPKIPREGDEDRKLMPVLFFIHGGSFDSIWGGIFGGHRLMRRENIVVVTINYRLGLLGSLNLNVDEAPGNAAMYDVITALQWVQKYIHHFGGDKDSVTVSGHSAGAVMATHLLNSPMLTNSNLFHKVIGLSGSSVSIWATCTDPLSNYLRIARHASCNQTDNKEIAICMRGKSVDELMQALSMWNGEEEIEGRFGMDAKIPSIQIPSSIPNTPVFLDETPLNVFLQGKQKNIPVMMGATRHDGSFMAEATYNDFIRPQGWLDDMPKLRNDLFPVMLKGLGMEDRTGGAMIHSFAHTYLGPTAMNSDNFTDMIPGLIDIHSVLAFKAGAYNLLELHSKLNKQSFYFAFDYYGLWTVDGGPVIPGGDKKQVGHIDSVFYLFQAFPLVVWPNDLQVASRFADYWVNFATHGNPNGPDGSNILFPPFDPHTHTYLIINGTDKIGYNCRDSWVDNSIEIKDHKRPGWPDFQPSSTTTPLPFTETTTELTSEATISDGTQTDVTSTSTSTTVTATSSSTSEQPQPNFADFNKPLTSAIIVLSIFNLLQ